MTHKKNCLNFHFQVVKYEFQIANALQKQQQHEDIQDTNIKNPKQSSARGWIKKWRYLWHLTKTVFKKKDQCCAGKIRCWMGKSLEVKSIRFLQFKQIATRISYLPKVFWIGVLWKKVQNIACERFEKSRKLSKIKTIKKNYYDTEKKIKKQESFRVKYLMKITLSISE